MGALLKFSGFDILFSLTFSKSSNGFSAFRSWKSPIASGSTEDRAVAFLQCSRLASRKADLVLRRLGLSVAVKEGGLTSDWDLFLNSSREERVERVKMEGDSFVVVR